MKRSLVNPDQTELAADDSSSVACYQHGERLANSGKYKEALVSFDRAIALQPNDAAAWVFRSVVLIHLGRYQEALLGCDRAIKICPTNSEAWTFRGVALQRLGRYPEAYASYNHAVGRQPVSLWQWLRRQSLRPFWKASL